MKTTFLNIFIQKNNVRHNNILCSPKRKLIYILNHNIQYFENTIIMKKILGYNIQNIIQYAYNYKTIIT